MDSYINKVVEKMQEDCEPSANIEWVKSILTKMSQLSYEAGQQSQQAKVEKAQTNAELLNEALQRSVTREEELQKRIDDSIFILSTIDNPDEAYKAIDLLLRALRGEQALKGESNE